MALNIKRMGRAPKRHIPIALVIDCSCSMNDIRPILNRATQSLLTNLKNNVELRQQVKLLTIHYNDTIRVVSDFTPAMDMEDSALDIAQGAGTTDTGLALLTALERLDEMQSICLGKKEVCSKPLVFLLTDGYPDAGNGAPDDYVQEVRSNYKEAAAAIREREANDSLYFCAVGIQRQNGIGANMDMLKQLSEKPDRIFRMDDASIQNEGVERFCQMIYDTAKAMSNNTPLQDALYHMLG